MGTRFHRKTVMFAVLALFITAVAVSVGLNRDLLQAAMTFPIIAFLLYLSWKQHHATTTGRSIADERTKRISERAASTAFWILLLLIAVQTGFAPIPPGYTEGLYLLVGGTIVIGYQLYYRLWI